MAKIILHLPEADITKGLPGRHMRLYRVIRDMAAREGIGLEIRPRSPDLTPATREVTDGRFDDGNLHIVDDRSIRAPGVLNAAVAYFWEFWHLDPKGTKACSSIGDLTYQPGAVPFKRAKTFFDAQRAKLVLPRKSKYGQKEDRTDLPKGAIAVFLQGEYPMKQQVTRFDDLAMLAAVQAADIDRPILVKPHPLVKNPFAHADVALSLRQDSRMILTDANVHDILDACAVTVSINSTVALEGFLHRRPAVLFGQSDFHHIAGRVRQAEDFPAVLEAEMQRKGGYAQYLTWYFRNCLRIGSPGLEAAIWARFAAVGFTRERFGLT